MVLRERCNECIKRFGGELGVCRHQPAVAAQSAVRAGSPADWESSSLSLRSSSSASPPSLSPPPDSVVPATERIAKGVNYELNCLSTFNWKKKKKTLNGIRDLGTNVFHVFSSTGSSLNPPPLTITATDLLLTWSCVEAKHYWIQTCACKIFLHHQFHCPALPKHFKQLMIWTWHF